MHRTNHQELIEELIHTKALVLGISNYIEKKRKQQRWFDIIITILAAVGSLSFCKINIVTFCSTVLIALASIAKVVVDSEQNLAKLDKLWCRQNTYCTDLEKIYSNVYHDGLKEKDYLDSFYSLKEKYSSDLSEINELTHSNSENLVTINREEAILHYDRKFPISK